MGQAGAVLAVQEMHLVFQAQPADEGVKFRFVVREVRRRLTDQRQVGADVAGQVGQGADRDIRCLEWLQTRGEHDVSGPHTRGVPGACRGME